MIKRNAFRVARSENAMFGSLVGTVELETELLAVYKWI